MYKLIFLVLIAAATFSFSCRQNSQTGKNAGGDVNKASELATDPEQQRLWKAALEKNQTNTLANIPVPGDPVQGRTPPAVPNVQVDAKPQPLPQNMAGGVRLIKSPDLGGRAFSNSVRVRSVEGEQIELDLGGEGTLSVFARARRGPLRVAVGDTARLDLRLRDDPYDRQRIFALRLENGDGIVSALDSGDRPVTITIPLFELTASQTGGVERNAMSVTVSVGGEQRVVGPGQTVEFEKAGVTVGIIGSSAYIGDDNPGAEGRPYALNIVAWPNR